MSEEVNPATEFSLAGSWQKAASAGGWGEPFLVKSLQEFCAAVSKAGDFSTSGKMREILECPDTKNEAYQALLQAEQCKQLAIICQSMYQSFAQAAQGKILEAKDGAKYVPIIMAPDNPLGHWIKDQLISAYRLLGLFSEDEKLDTVNLKDDKKGGFIIEKP